jgi:hypothetical protein
MNLQCALAGLVGRGVAGKLPQGATRAWQGVAIKGVWWIKQQATFSHLIDRIAAFKLVDAQFKR